MRLDTYLNAMCRAFAIVVVLQQGDKRLMRSEDRVVYNKRKMRQFHTFRNRIIQDFLNLQAELDSESRWAHYYHRLLEEAEIDN